jgi:DNA recombination protein RmuC
MPEYIRMIFQNNYDIIIVAATGVIFGAVVFGLAIKLRLKTVFERKLAALDSRKALVEEKLNAQLAISQELRHRLEQRDGQVHQLRSQLAKLDVARAALETTAGRIPALEQELSGIKSGYASLQNDLRNESAALAKAQAKALQLEKMEAEMGRKDEQLQALRNQNAQLAARIAELKTLLGDERKQASEKIALLNEARDQLKNEFQNLAHQIFDDKSKNFTELNRINMDHLISPLRDQIGDFKKRVEDVYDKESRDRASLQTQIHHLKELNQRISKEALNLTQALKGDSKARGSWGEVVLERVLEASGLQKGREYETQVRLKDGKGNRYQPDVIVRLPKGKDVVVDAKVSLNDYEIYYSTEDADQKEMALKAHIESIRIHIRSLASKRYEALEGVCSLDFVLMFIPIEAAFLAAVERDTGLFSEAFDKNILVVSPSTLLVTLRTIENIWRHEYQNRHCIEIANKAGGLYNKFVGFVDALQEVGRHLDRAKAACKTASDRLVNGRGNLIRRTQELKALGVKAGKELPENLLEMAQDGEMAGD